jgi:hypothetical protein
MHAQCSAFRYKIRRDDPGDVEGGHPRKRVPAKVMWYAPIIPQLKHSFRNNEHAKLLRWHKEDCKSDVMLSHPADGSQWRKIEREFLDFMDNAQNLRFGLSRDGVNPFGEQSCSHSTWPMTLCIYNLPLWLCMKRKFIMMPVHEVERDVFPAAEGTRQIKVARGNSASATTRTSIR